jgi:hypothetical protein
MSRLTLGGSGMCYYRNTACAWHPTINNALSNKLHKPLLASRVQMEAMSREVLSHKMIRTYTSSGFDQADTPIQPQIIMPLKDTDKSHVCIGCLLHNEVDVLLCWVIIIPIRLFPGPPTLTVWSCLVKFLPSLLMSLTFASGAFGWVQFSLRDCHPTITFYFCYLLCLEHTLFSWTLGSSKPGYAAQHSRVLFSEHWIWL